MRAAVRRLRRLLVLLPSAGIGGAERHTAALARALAGTGIEVAVAAEPGLLPGLAPLFAPLALEAAPVGWREAEGREANTARQAAAAATLIARLRPDAALLPLPWPSHGPGLQDALADAGLPGLAIVHLAPFEPERLPPPRGLLAWAAVSAPVARRVEAAFALSPGRVAVVPNGVAVPREDPGRRSDLRQARRTALRLPEGAPLLLFAGRLEEKKGADLLPALAEQLHQAAGARLVALGDGPLQLMGEVPDVSDWMLVADALLVPSRLEGCPLVVLEAAVRRCPVIGTAPALEAWGEAARNLFWMIESQSLLTMTAQISVIILGLRATDARIEAAEAHAIQYDIERMLHNYFVLLRASLGGSGVAQAG